MKKLSLNQQGAASLITVILLAIILSITTTGLLRLSVQDARQATDDDLTNRAFYAAESGLNDAIRFAQKELVDLNDGNGVDNYSLNGDNCAPPPAPNEPANIGQLAGGVYDTEYVCQLIDMQPEFIRSVIPENGSTQIPLIPATIGSATGIKVRWHNLDSDGTIGSFRVSGDTTLPSALVWSGAGHPALMRVNLFSSPKALPFTRAQLQNYVGFFTPTNALTAVTNQTAMDGNVVSARCTNNITLYGGYACEADISITDLATRDYELRLNSQYRSAQIEVSFLGGSDFVGAQALIDVTGRAADVFRRVQASVNLSESASRELPSYSVRSAQEICKVITIDTAISYNCSAP